MLPTIPNVPRSSSAFAAIHHPCIIRSNAATARDWSPGSLARDFGEARVNALVFDGGVQGSDISASDMSFSDFRDAAVNGFEVDGGEDEGAFVDPVLYLLLTTRGLEGDAGNMAMDPNPGSELLGLLDGVGFVEGLMGEGLVEAWSNLRLGAGYDYPVHVDW